MIAVYILAGILVGGALIWFVQESRLGKDRTREAERAENALAELNRLRDEFRMKDKENQELHTAIATANTEKVHLSERLEEDRKKIEELEKRFRTEFENIANKLLTEKSEVFTKQNKENLDTLLKPLNDRIREFQDKVETTHKESIEHHSTLKEQISGLKDLNEQMSKEAMNLTKALKGDVKAQGNWGEMLLESILEKSGLIKGREYSMQESMTNAEGRRLQPDVVINLPNERYIIIDSKVSLVAYDRYVASEDPDEKTGFVKEHVASLRNHIKGLNTKDYQDLHGLKSLDFVLLFVPIEPALTLAIQHGEDLWSYAFERNIVIVSPSTLLATLRTIENIWKQEKQNQNALTIATEAGKMYDKFAGFVEDMQKLGKQLETTRNTYEDSMKKLHTGRGNLVDRATKIKTLGASTSKSLPPDLVENSGEE